MLPGAPRPRAGAVTPTPPDEVCSSDPHGCPCGYYGDPRRACTCSTSALTKYRRKLSGPLLDRIDVHVEVPRVEYDKMSGDGGAEASAVVRARVMEARERQRVRVAAHRLYVNAEIPARLVPRLCQLEPDAEALLRAAHDRLSLSGRGHHRLRKLARTIADLDASEVIRTAHLAEALQYRPRLDA